MQDLRLTLIQTDIHWQSISANLEKFGKEIHQIKAPTDVIVLPEMFTTGFTMNTDLAESMNGQTFNWMKETSEKSKAVITGSFIVKDNGKIFNRLIWMQPDGNYATYDKRHLFRMAGEHNHFDFGEKRMIVEWKGWKIMLQVCYDLRFPVWSRNINLDYDTILFVANWPAVRIDAWDSLLKARAIENLAYSIGLNRIGIDGKEIKYNGHSAVYSPKGETLVFSEEKESISVELNKEELDSYRSKFPAHLDADEFNIHHQK